MRRRAIVFLSVTVVLLALAAGPASGQSAASAACERGTADADDGDRALVGTFPGSSEPIDDGAAVYPGTELRLVLCEGDDPLERPSVWSLSDGDGYEMLDDRGRETSVRVRITGEGDAVTFGDSVEQVQVEEGFGVELAGANPASPSVGTESPLYGVDPGAYEERESEFLTAHDALEAATEDLNESAAAIRAGNADPERVSARIESVNESSNALEANASAFRSYLFDEAVASETPGTPATLVTIADATDDRRTQSTDAARASLKAYDAALADRTATLRSTIRWNVILGLLPGLLVGGAVGAYVPYRAADSALQQSKLTSDARFSKRAVVLPVAVGVLLLVGTVVALAAADALAVFEVIL